MILAEGPDTVAAFIAEPVMGIAARYRIDGGAARPRDGSGFARMRLAPVEGPADAANISAEWSAAGALKAARELGEQGIDVEVMSINPWWYAADRDMARRICDIQNEKLMAMCQQAPDRLMAFAAVSLQFPELEN